MLSQLHYRHSRTYLTAALLILGAPALHATNGMNMEGYGPIAAAMGGTSMAFENGTAAVINNPATLGLQGQGNRLDLALGILGPDITATNPGGQSAKSKATAFYMPAFGYTRRSGDLVYGFGVFGQGGMGCQYGPDTWRGLGFNLENRTAVSVGRAIVPLSWNVNDKLIIAATVDFIWGGMSLRMAMSGTQFSDLVTPTSQHFGRATGSIVQSFGQVMQMMPAGTSVDYAYFDFSNGNMAFGEAKGYGYAGKIGVLYQPSKELAIGLTLHSKTELSDLKASGDHLSFQLNVPGMGHMPQSLVGDFRVRDFEWPAMLGGGIAWRPTTRWLLAADVREIFWQGVMQEFHMTFQAANSASNGSFSGQNLDAMLYQYWKNETVVMLGAAYQASDRLTLRLGCNLGSNPVPDQYLNCLFPAIVKDHLTAGFGWRFTDRSSVDVAVSRGFGITRTSGYGITIDHSQLNWQAMYSLRF